MPSRFAQLSRRGSVVVAAGVLALAPACRKKDAQPQTADDPTTLAQDGTDSSAVESDQELLTSSLVSASSSGSLTLASSSDLAGGELTPAGIGDGAKALYFPRGCLTVDSDEPNRTVTYRFADCSGPNGLFHVTGEVKATYAMRPGSLVLDVVGTDLTMNRATVDFTSHAEITATNVERTMRWRAQISGKTGRGRDLSRTSDKTISWRLGERCFAFDGTSEGSVSGRDVRTTISGFRRCQGACPEAGGTITIANPKTNVQVTIVFDGTNRATYTGPDGKEGTLPLLCQG